MVDQQNDEAIVLVWIPIAISTVLVALRTYCRHSGRDFGWDDWLMLVAWVFGLIEAVAGHEMTVWTWAGYHLDDVPEQTVAQQVIGLKWSYVLQIIYHYHLGIIRASIILFLFRIGDLRRGIQISLHTVFWFNIACTIGITTANIFECTPVKYVYDQPAMDRVVDGEVVPGGKCIDMLPFILSSAGFNIVMDLIIIPIPTAMVWKLSMRRKTKFAVIIVMSLGWIATGISAARFGVFYNRYQLDVGTRNHDIGYTISMWETNAAMWAACAPALKRLMRTWSPRLFGHNTGENSDYYNSSSNAPWTGNRSARNRRQRTKSSLALSSGRHSDGELFRMRDLNPDESESQVNFVRAHSPPENGFGFKVGVGVDPSSSTSK